MKSRLALRALTACLIASGVGAASTGTAHACTPHYTGYGPTVTVEPDYNHPANSQVGYDSSDMQIMVYPCV